MAYYPKPDLVQKINDWVKANGNRAITGAMMQELLRDILDNTSHRSVKETFIVSPQIQNDSQITIGDIPLVNSEHVIVFYDGVMLEEGSGNDYTINGRDINFEFALSLSLKIVVLYKTISIV